MIGKEESSRHHDHAHQHSHGAALAAALHAALLPADGTSCPPQKAVTIVRACAALLCARNCPDKPMAAAGAGEPMFVFKSFGGTVPFWSALDLISLAEAASQHQMPQTAVYLLEGHHARASAIGFSTPIVLNAAPSNADSAY